MIGPFNPMNGREAAMAGPFSVYTLRLGPFLAGNGRSVVSQTGCFLSPGMTSLSATSFPRRSQCAGISTGLSLSVRPPRWPCG